MGGRSSVTDSIGSFLTLSPVDTISMREIPFRFVGKIFACLLMVQERFRYSNGDHSFQPIIHRTLI